ncbi:DsbA family protein [Pseudarthrobacter albicanus]|uniref:DsbA family protein n=1 Tax=Pseudarthrobacter albicanus TaxID=2823873 RepID=UPI001BABB838|nr:DsbA family protein [Pseudarthrobacter albicanus]
MDFELRTIRDCPNSGPALELFRKALAAEEKETQFLTVRLIASESEAEELQFHGSPSFIADGRDLFPAETAPALSCRLYRSGHGVAGLPSEESLRAAVRGLGSGA